MKKLILVAVILLSLSMSAQDGKDNYFSASWGFDIKNAWQGSEPTNNERALNWTAEAHAVAENFDYYVGYESFERLNYSRRIVGLGYHIPISYIRGTDIKFNLQPSIEYSNITREWVDGGFKNKDSWGTASVNLNLNWDMNEYFAVQVATNGLPRPDKRDIYHEDKIKIVWSNTIKVVVKIPHNKKN